MAKKQHFNLRWKIAQWAEIRWWKRYLSKKTPEDYLAQKAAYWQRVMKELGIAVPPGSTVLDAGCGPAGIFMVLDGAAVTAIDPLLERYQALPHFQPARYVGVAFRQMALEDLEEGAMYDYVFCLNVINHVADMPLVLLRLWQALKPAGTCWLSVDAHRYPVLQPVFAAIPGDVLHPHQYTLSQYEAQVKRAGFSILRKQLLKPGGLFDYWIFELKKA
jgi:2-polyprenyl-6-hydroxyphenyl methylase/3-demethylubiquinone-9 3-methyltransferase